MFFDYWEDLYSFCNPKAAYNVCKLLCKVWNPLDVTFLRNETFADLIAYQPTSLKHRTEI